MAQMSGDPKQLTESLNKLKLYFVINGVLILIGFAIATIAILISGASMLALLGEM